MKNRLINRQKSFNTNDIIIFITMFLADVLGVYMSMGMTIKISQGKTLFGDSRNYKTGTVEINYTPYFGHDNRKQKTPSSELTV